MEWLVTLIVLLLLALIPANIAKSKGKSFGTWYIYGVLLFLIALIHSIALKDEKKPIETYEKHYSNAELNDSTEMTKKCPYCAETIKYEAVLCRYCGKDLPAQTVNGSTKVSDKIEESPSRPSSNEFIDESNESIKEKYQTTSDEVEKVALKQELVKRGFTYYKYQD